MTRSNPFPSSKFLFRAALDSVWQLEILIKLKMHLYYCEINIYHKIV